MTEKCCYNGAACQMQDKTACFHACTLRMAQAPAIAVLDACTNLVGALGRHHAREWISVKDGLPDEGTEVAVWIPAFGRPYIGYMNWDYENGWTIDEGVPLEARTMPSHWMPLPAAPLAHKEAP